MSMTHKLKKYKRKKSTQKVHRVAPYKSMQEAEPNGRSIRKYLISSSKFYSRYKRLTHLTQEEIYKRVLFLSDIDNYLLEELDSDLISYLSLFKSYEDYLSFIIPIIEDSYIHLLPKFYIPRCINNESVYVSSELLNTIERYYLYLYLNDYDFKEIRKKTRDTHEGLTSIYIQRVFAKLRKAFQYPNLS